MKKRLLAVALHMALVGADANFTNYNLHGTGFREHDPIARPFLKNTPALMAYFSASAGLQLYLPHVLRKHHHHKLAAIADASGYAASGYGAVTSMLWGRK